MRTPELSETFLGRYEIERELGRGSFATVYLARDIAVGRDVALKIVEPDKGTYRERTVNRFFREAKVIANLQDPATVTLYEFGESEDGLLYMVFEYVPGEDLSEAIWRDAPFSPLAVIRILRQVLGSLREAHDQGVLHRDIKPGNISIFEYAGDPYTVKLLDFGVVKSLDPEETQITAQGAIVGTPRYMSPEQVRGEQLSPASDLYALGLVAYEMLAGHPAVRQPSVAKAMRAHLVGDPFTLPDGAAPDSLRRVVEKMVRRDPATRYGSASEVVADLDKAFRELKRTGSVPGSIVKPAEDEIETYERRPLPNTRRPAPRPRENAAVTTSRPGPDVQGFAKTAVAIVLLVAVGVAIGLWLGS